MRNLIALTVAIGFVALQPGFVLATPNPDTGPGCGLGKKLWADWKGQKQIAPQMFMATTNVIGSYSFSIASGTSGCTNDGRIWDSERASLFIGVNYASLSEDMARGGGEHLASLATMMGVPVEHQPAFFSLAQDRYRTLMERGEDSPLAAIKAIQEASVGHPLLAGIAERP